MEQLNHRGLFESLKSPLASAPSRAGVPGHDVQFYEFDDVLATTVADFLVGGLRAGQPAIVIASEAHRLLFSKAITRLGYDLDEAIANDRVVLLDARQTLDCFLEGRNVNAELFEVTVGRVFERVIRQRDYLVVRAYGEMVNLLWKEGNTEGALALEELWNGLAKRYSFSLLCAYSMNGFFRHCPPDGLQRVCSAHAHVIPPESAKLPPLSTEH